ncbi:hypothetical protein NX722_28425 [Endozoicomonas gorgoniicola]|uniref:Uncharacterized protein n=1 Tax=Endozoicomonas gorgoniicola TaxID=1234144 RepID=A0ABT3N4C8_9GAMM|nr:hypothetical protein [Endozoicomonas gorgoniicola]MCW7556493.1 hypothetical protein [Endozoicomonas gorgoniicola]
MINKHSADWKAVEHWAQEKRNQAVARLIADNQSDKQRGIIAALDELMKLAEPDVRRNLTGTVQY